MTLIEQDRFPRDSGHPMLTLGGVPGAACSACALHLARTLCYRCDAALCVVCAAGHECQGNLATAVELLDDGRGDRLRPLDFILPPFATDPAPPPPRLSARCTCLPWASTVVICATHERGRWKIVGKLASGGAPLTLSANRYPAELREELKRRGYRLVEGWIDEPGHTGLAIYAKAEGGAS